MTDADNSVEELAAAIERFLERSPDAADTVEGIAKWWVFHPNVEQVGQAIELLEARDVLERVLTQAGNSVFRRA